MQKKWLLTCFFLWIVLLGSTNLWAQNTRYRLYDETSGLNRHSVFDIEKDSRGFYWLGTEKGIIRFDGANFVEVNPPPPYTFEQVQDLYIHDQSLYIIYNRQGCVRLDLKNYSFTPVTDLSLSGIIEKDDKTLLFTDKQGNLYTYKNNLRKRIYSSAVSAYRHPMYRKDSTLFVHFLKKGLHAFNLNDLSFKKNLGGDTLQTQMHFTDYNKKLLLTGNRNVFEITPALELKNTILPVTNQKDVTFINFEIPNSPFFIVRNKQLFKINNGNAEQIDLPNFNNVELRKIQVHNNNNILIPTNAGLLHIQTDPSPITTLSDQYIQAPNEIRIRRKIIPLNNEEYVLFGYPRNYRYRKGNVYPLKMTMASSYDALKIGDDIYFTTEDKGAFKYSISKNTVDAITAIPATSAYSIAHDQQNNSLLFGSKNQIFTYSIQTKKVYTYSIPLASNYIQSLLYDSTQKRYWVGTDSGLVCLNKNFQPIKIIKKTTDLSKNLDVTELIIHSKRRELWIAHRYGVEIIDPVTFKTVKNLSETFFENPVAAGLIEDTQGRMWMPTYNGLYAFESKTEARLRLGSRNELTNKEFNLKSFAVLPNGKLILGGITGYDIIDPLKFTLNRSSDIGLITGYERIFSDSSQFQILDDRLSSIQFNIDEESIRIYLSARKDLNSGKYRYEYQFNNDGWISMKEVSFLNIYKLDPGLYKLRFRGYDEYGTLITFKPIYLNANVVFYKNRYFIWALFLITLALIIFVVTNELNRKKRENLLKEQISMDLHDEVGTILTRALMVSQVPGIPQKEEKVKNYLSEALFSLRVYINTMNKHSFSLFQMSDEMKELISKTFPENQYTVTLHINIESDKEISSEKYRDMKLCLFEIMNNVLKHSKAKNINVEFTVTPLLIRVQITDDGVLNDIELLEEKGNGIRNIRKRVKKHNGLSHFAISDKGHGLETTLICPQ